MEIYDELYEVHVKLDDLEGVFLTTSLEPYAEYEAERLRSLVKGAEVHVVAVPFRREIKSGPNSLKLPPSRNEGEEGS
jgi:hypothetical protein